MDKINIRLTAIILLIFLSGCGTVLKGPKMSEVHSQLPQLTVDTARVHFIRPGKKALGGKARIHIDDKRVMELPLSGCHYEVVSAGKHTLMLDLWGGIGSHEMDITLEPMSSHYYKIWPRQARSNSMLALGVVGASVENLAADTKNDGEMEFIELTEKEALPLLEQCVLYKAENQ